MSTKQALSLIRFLSDRWVVLSTLALLISGITINEFRINELRASTLAIQQDVQEISRHHYNDHAQLMQLVERIDLIRSDVHWIRESFTRSNNSKKE